MISRRGGRSTTTCAIESGKAFGQARSTPSSWTIGNGRVGKPRPPPPSSTARPSRRRIKRGIKDYVAGKKVHGRKRHILTDTDGRLLAVQVHAADIQDRDGAKGVLRRSRSRFRFVETFFADDGYAGRLLAWANDKTHVTLEIVRRMPWMKGFVVIRRRLVVERTFAWFMKCRRLARDYEQLPSVAETLFTIAAVATLIRRWP